MNTEITRRVSPEEEELAKKREELVLLQVELAERELFLTNLRAELAAFEGQYLRQVGTLYAELDEWNARIAEQLAEQEGTEEARAAAAQARTEAEESRAAAQGEAAESREFRPSPELKRLYPEVPNESTRTSPPMKRIAASASSSWRTRTPRIRAAMSKR
jgi:peptidoglycan hydrolase CwlO-like protein